MDDYEYDDSYDDEDEEDVYLPCPNCKQEIYEDAPKCPYCGEYVTHSTALNPIWKWTAILLLAGAFVILLSQISSR